MSCFACLAKYLREQLKLRGDATWPAVELQDFPVAKKKPLSYAENRKLRARHLAPALKMHYDGSAEGPIKLAYGEGQYLYDTDGQRYIDCVNNVCHVGHCHPRVVAAAAAQLAELNTNSRYMHDNIVNLAERLTSTMPSPLDVVMFTNSGSEA